MNLTDSPSQEVPLAKINGEVVVNLPKGLFIPPDALEVFLEAFEGPLDLLLYLIRSHNLDILNIPIAEITRQYMEYVALMEALNLELAADYLLMAAMLAEIKSRMLLPRIAAEEDNNEGLEDPRMELVRRLRIYECYKKAAEDLDELPRMERDTFEVKIEPPTLQREKQQPQIELERILSAFHDVLQRAELYTHHTVTREVLSVRERMSFVLNLIATDHFIPFTQLFSYEEGRCGVVVTLLAILELHKEQLIELVQAKPYEMIHVKGVC